jgi:hypothetical protein
LIDRARGAGILLVVLTPSARLTMLRATALVFLIAVPAFAGEDPKLPGPKIDFPDVKGFTRGKVTVFPQAELGYSVPYNAPGLTVTLYVYNGGKKEIPDGARSDAVKAEMKGTLKALEDARKAGYYKSVKEVGEEGTVTLGKGKDRPQALHRRFEVEHAKAGPALSETYLTGYKNHFLKFRISYDPENKPEAEKLIATLVDALGAELK